MASITLQGQAFLDEKKIREQILTPRSRLRPSWLNPRLAAEDAEAIRALYASFGFLGAEVSFRVDTPESDRRAAVTFVIEEGPRYALRSLQFSGNAEVSTPELDREGVRPRLGLGRGSTRHGEHRSHQLCRATPSCGGRGTLEPGRSEAAALPAQSVHGRIPEAEFARLFVQWSRYSRALGEAVWSVGLRSGVAKPFGASVELPISERYFAGGETSIRGFALDSLIASGTPPELMMDLAPGESFGGDALLVLNQEVTQPIHGPLYGVVFYDVGNLYWRLGDFDPTDLRHSAGLGLRVQSPFGPIRLEYGWKLDRRQTESAGQTHFGLGLAF